MSSIGSVERKSNMSPGRRGKQLPIIRAFFDAVRAGNVRTVRAILRRNELPNINVVDTTDKTRPTALIIACQNGDLEMVKTLFKAKPKTPDVNLTNRKGRRPIWIATNLSNVEIVEILLKRKKVEVDFLDPITGMTPLFTSIMRNSAPICQLLIHAKADVNLRQLGFDSEAESPLIKAVQLNNLKICELLVNSLCHIEARTESGFSALHYAVAYRRYDICQFLLEQKIDLHGQSRNGVTAMTLAIAHQVPRMVSILIQFGYSFEKKYKWAETPLEHAIAVHSEECAMTLVHWGCPLFVKSDHQKPSYFQAAMAEGLFTLGRLLSELNPLFLNESWLKNRVITLSLYHKPHLCSWLFARSSNPMPLQYICRARIWASLGKYAPKKVLKLPLPKRLLEFVSFSEFFFEEMYNRKGLELRECPFDCVVNCDFNDCPPIEFLPSDESE
ncbi:uncharacterized protein LOC141902548 [Tubulanus polymorphus]|uniref:uncharacterized protein LOC141902548 n=1 Tax=Tubulanus polymorphus TaxID=672921 RepID=UPI003DA40E77